MLQGTPFLFEYFSVGAGIGSGFENTSKLKVVKYREAINGVNREGRKNILNRDDRMARNKIV